MCSVDFQTQPATFIPGATVERRNLVPVGGGRVGGQLEEWERGQLLVGRRGQYGWIGEGVFFLFVFLM